MASMLFGGAMPGFCLIFGEMIDGVGGAEGIDSLKEQGIIMVLVGVFSMIFSGLQITLWSVFAQRIAEKTRIAYFRACLH
jgi:ABC-type bacteriocin/lantibiotic exporter with double-glycine peptidase domain